MATYTNESLEKVNKRDMINLVLCLQSKLDEANNRVFEEVRKLSDAFLKLQFELAVLLQVNSLLANRLTNVVRQCWEIAQYSRREFLDVVGIPSEVGADVLEEKVLNIFDKFGCDIPPEEIEACHRISKTISIVILKFTKKKDFQQVWSVTRDLQKIKMEDVNLPGQNKLFINRNLCPYYKVLWSKNKKLHSLGKIFSVYISGDTIKIKVSENSSPLSVTHVDDFGKLFPDIDLSPPECSE